MGTEILNTNAFAKLLPPPYDTVVDTGDTYTTEDSLNDVLHAFTLFGFSREGLVFTATEPAPPPPVRTDCVIYLSADAGDDANNGLIDTPVLTVQRAIEILKSLTLHGNVQFIFEPGEYDWEYNGLPISTGRENNERSLLSFLGSFESLAGERTVDSVTTVLVLGGLQKVITDDDTLGDDETYNGARMRFLTGASADQTFTIMSQIGEDCTLTRSPTVTAGDTYVLERPAVTINLVSNVSLKSSDIAMYGIIVKGSTDETYMVCDDCNIYLGGVELRGESDTHRGTYFFQKCNVYVSAAFSFYHGAIEGFPVDLNGAGEGIYVKYVNPYVGIYLTEQTRFNCSVFVLDYGVVYFDRDVFGAVLMCVNAEVTGLPAVTFDIANLTATLHVVNTLGSGIYARHCNVLMYFGNEINCLNDGLVADIGTNITLAATVGTQTDGASYGIKLVSQANIRVLDPNVGTTITGGAGDVSNGGTEKTWTDIAGGLAADTTNADKLSMISA